MCKHVCIGRTYLDIDLKNWPAYVTKYEYGVVEMSNLLIRIFI